jgi:hypothetical protein
MACMSSVGGAPVTMTPCCASVSASRDCRDPRRRDRGQVQSRHVQLVELFGALRAGPDPAGMLDGLGEQAGEVGVAQGDTRPGQPRPHRVGVDITRRRPRTPPAAGTAGCCG